MKLATFARGGADRLGVLLDDETKILDLAAAAEAVAADAAPFASMLALIDAGPEGLEAAQALRAKAPSAAVSSLKDVVLRAPLPEPRQMRDCMAFEKHVKQSFAAVGKLRGLDTPPQVPAVWYEQPIYYKCNRFAVNDPDADVVRPAFSQLMDYELEMACVIGKTGVDIPAEQGRAHIFGYTIFNDFTARDAQAKEMEAALGPAKGKDFDGANPMGPFLVTADAIDPYNLTMIARVNGEERCRSSSSTMHWTFEQILAHVSRSETVRAGEIIGSGTVGDGCGLEHLTFLKDGDVVELEIEGVGVLRNRLVAPS